MPESVLFQIDFAPFTRLLGRLLDESYSLHVYDPAGQPVWQSRQLDGDSIDKGAILFAQSAGVSLHSEKLSDNKILFLHRLAAAVSEEQAGFLMLVTDRQSSREQISETVVFDSLADIAAGIERECHLYQEINNLAAELGERYEELHFVYSMGQLNKDFTSGQKIFTELTQLCIDFLKTRLACFLLPERGVLYSIQEGRKIDNLDLLLTRLRSELFRFVASGREPLVLNRIDDSRREYLCENMPYKILASPVNNKGRTKAIFILLRDLEDLDFSNSDRKLLDVVSDQAGILMQNHEMYNSLQIFTEQMAGALIEAVDAKDPYTRGHSDRVNFFSMQIGKAMDLPKDNLQALFWASLLHDIGKIGVPDLVLSKPGRLDQDEYTFMKTHPDRGYDILKKVGQLKPALEGIRHHHERYDGRGYPFGLQANSIPLHARIIAVADTYDAMTSSRSYRPARSHAEAIAEIRNVSGCQLDPDIVKIWASVIQNHPDIINHVASSLSYHD